jgi:transcriptional regulator with XRE-family HTH domain
MIKAGKRAAAMYQRCPMSVSIHRNRAAKQSRGRGRPEPQSNLVLDLRKRLGLSQALFARLIPVSVRTLASLESSSAPSEATARRIKELSRLTDSLTEIIKRESLGKWLQTPNHAFDSLKPLEVIERGEIDRIWSMIYFLRSGVAS